MVLNLDRRNFLKGTVVLAGSAFAFVQEMRGHSLVSILIEPQKGSEPILLDSSEILTISAIASQIIPTTDQPGAAEVGVVVYVNSKISKDSELRQLYKEGFEKVDGTSLGQYRQPFHRLTFDQQKGILQGIEESPFFSRIRRHTVEAFYGSSVGVFVASGQRAGTRHHLCSDNEGFLDVDQKPKL